jgi:hypothetical protein
MSPENPIGLCCARPQINAVGGIDERAWPFEVALALRRLKRTLDQRAKCRQSNQIGPAEDKAALHKNMIQGD